MSKKNGYYIPLPEDFLDNPKIQKLIARCGLGAVTIFHDLQTRMRDYERDDETSFMIPVEDISFLCRRYCMTEEELHILVNQLAVVELIKFRIFKDNSTGIEMKYFYSEDILENCTNWIEKRERMAELGRRSGVRRRLNSKHKNEEEEDES